MKSLSLLALGLVVALCSPRQAGAATITVGPTDCSASAVNAAIGSASDGDTVLLSCTGSVTWSSTVSIPATKGITLMVKGGTNTPKNSAVFPLVVTGSLTSSPTLQINVGSNHKLSRVSGFKFRNTGTTTGTNGYILITGQGQGSDGLGGFRFDNNYLDTISAEIILAVHSNGGPMYGVIDNNTMHDGWLASNPDYGPYGLDFAEWWNSGNSCWGQSGWSNSFSFGSKNFTFVEDNLFENVTSGRYMRHYFSSAIGGRYVSRYNTFTVNTTSPAGYHTDLMEGHGLCTCSSTGCGTRGAEVYHNNIGGTQIGRHVVPRGGSWLIYDNTFLNLGTYSSPIYLMEYRAFGSPDCTATCPCASSLGFTWYPSVTDGTHYPLPQQISGTYIWNNVYNGTNQLPAVDKAGVQTLYIQANRDYFASTSKPTALSSYAPYTYPHPLREPAAPSNVIIK